MIDWVNLAAQSVWVLGLALIVATIGFEDYTRRAAGRPLRATWRALTGNRWARAGLLLFAAGMALTSDSWLTIGLWGLLAVYLGWGWWRQPRTGADTPAGGECSPTRQPETSAGRRLAARFLEAEPLWLALLAPLFLFPTPAGNWAFLALPALWLLRRLLRGHFVPPTPLDWPLALLLLMALVSFYATPDPAFSAPVIARFVYGVAWYYALVDWTGPTRTVWAIYGLVGVGVGLAILALLGTSWTSKVPVLQRLAGALPSLLRSLASTSNGFNPNVVAGVLLWILPLQLVLLLAPPRNASLPARYRTLGRILVLLSALLTLAVFVLAQSRAALVGLAVGVLALLLLAGRWGRLLAAVLVVGGLIVLIGIGPQRLFDTGTTADSTATANLGSTLSLQNRAEIWSRAIYGIEDFPFTGMGMGTFRHLLPILYPLPWTSPDSDVGHAHNQFLQAGVDLGIPGLVAYLAVWLSAGALAVQIWRRHSPGWARVVAAGLGAALLSSLVFGMIDSVVFTAKPGILFWAVLGVLVSVWQATSTTGSGHPAGRFA